ncbi:MAG: L-histidine N(alpha)-methyltransferase [Tunicatimonas sp.]
MENPEINAIAEKVNRAFAADVYEGLTAPAKFLPSKYLYDQRGDAIFQEIMAMEAYYPTRSEDEIFRTYKEEMLSYFGEGDKKFQLIEFGAGDGTKTKVLLRYFWEQSSGLTYVPIDISANIIRELTNDLRETLPGLRVRGICDDYFRAFDQLADSEDEGARKVVLFLGANVGNFDATESVSFLKKIAQQLSPDDRLMIGFDLKKDPQRILDAYFDKEGVTKSFKLNLLRRINRELGGNFDVDTFQYFPIYHPAEGSILSYLVSTKEQDVTIDALDQTVHFVAWETIYMERSQKYSERDIATLAEKTGFRVVRNFFDKERLFADSLWALKGNDD